MASDGDGLHLSRWFRLVSRLYRQDVSITAHMSPSGRVMRRFLDEEIFTGQKLIHKL